MLARDETEAGKALGEALGLIRAPWELETTVRNLRLIREARERRGEADTWAAEMEKELAAA